MFPQGPCGEEWDDEYDSMDETKPLWGNPRADGISLACKDSIVERNVSLPCHVAFLFFFPPKAKAMTRSYTTRPMALSSYLAPPVPQSETTTYMLAPVSSSAASTLWTMSRGMEITLM